METRRIGPVDVSSVGVGCNNFGKRISAERSVQVVHAALEHGINFFDTADVYGDRGRSEEALGRALHGRRDSAIIATKFGGEMGDGLAGARPDYVHQACDASLRRLGVDHIDLYQLHMPDENTPIEETLGALSELVNAGKVRVLGCSNFDVDRLTRAQRAADAQGLPHFASVQNEYSLLAEANDHARLVATMQEYGVVYLPYYPLAAGMLTGKYDPARPPERGTRLAGNPAARDKWFTDANFAAVARLRDWAEDHNHTVLEVAFSWLLAHPEVASVIAGASSGAQISANAAAGAWTLTPEQVAQVDALRPALPAVRGQ